ncbi:PREDICTED: threonine--tRNA ligase, mitochondrial-like [Brassica oleracea var. oleracea]|uniref:threonine--tRNA ligase, mitochondrial-like n=1 Tax=Brassica oleracea var. oleracea TaxID=109376 RepID=UPI0006A6CAAB|nr:PREDICTED: threonine--tRNA ligase, mitochondrial-like [Brassica oleracea var. oleracea]
MADEHPRDEAYLSAVIEKRIRLFEEFQAKQLAEIQSRPHDPIKVTIRDGGNVKEGKRWETTPAEIARQISVELANSALISSVNDVLWDMNRPLEADCSLEFFSFDSDKGRDTFWRSSAHILAQVLEQEYGCKLCIGPCKARDEGFFYDAFYGDLGLNEQHFPDTEAGDAREGHPFERIEVTRGQALEMFPDDNTFKVELLTEDKTTVYRCGPLVDLCSGPHIPNTSFVKAFKCLNLLSVLLGHHHQLFFCHPLSPGSWFFEKHGTRVYNKLMHFIGNEYRKRGYEEVISPNIYNMKLWETSGHAANYKENMYTFDIDKQEFGLKPMNCPGHCLMFQHRLRSYKELPIRLADFGVLHRNEASEALSGLTHTRRFQQDDAHIFCTKDQVSRELKRALEFVDYVYTKFGFTYELKLSTRPEKYLGDLTTWDRAERDLEEALEGFGKPFLVNRGAGEFYGPKIDITVSDAMKSYVQCATLQLDFQLPALFELEYTAMAEGNSDTPVMIHRAVLGSVERMFTTLVEHYKGKWPFWLSPRQAIVCSLSKDSHEYAERVREQIHEAGYYVDVDITDRNISKKVREAQVAQYNYILVVGAEETTTGHVTVRRRNEDLSEFPVLSVENLLDEFKLKTANFL